MNKKQYSILIFTVAFVVLPFILTACPNNNSKQTTNTSENYSSTPTQSSDSNNAVTENYEIQLVEENLRPYSGLDSLPRWKNLSNKEKLTIAKNICKIWINDRPRVTDLADKVAYALDGVVGVSMIGLNSRIDSASLVTVSIQTFCPKEFDDFRHQALTESLNSKSSK